MSKGFQPLVTIAIPTYNRADGYLKQAIQNALMQTYSHIEIIVSDNCSSDNTEMVVKGFSDPRIRYYRQKENIGAHNNFNFCLQQTSGEYFLLFHDDDMIDDDFVEVCMEAVKGSPGAGLIRTGVRTIDSAGNVIRERQNMSGGLSTEELFLAFLSHTAPMFLCGILFNTEKLKETGGFNTVYHLWDDVTAEFRVLAEFGRLDVPDVKASFRIHPAQSTFNVNIKGWTEDSLDLLDCMCALAHENKTLIRKEGMRYFSSHCYGIASKIRSPLKRFAANWVVFRKFQYRYLPPSIYAVLSCTPIYYPLRFIKRKINRFRPVMPYQ